MKYRLLFIGLLSVLFASLTMNVIHSESLEVAKESIKISDMVQTRVINSLNDRLIELEN
jgi:exosome complex RNA-binding protein Csl4